MKKSKLFAMMLIPAAFAACTNEDIVDGASIDQVPNGDVVEDVLFSVSMSADASATRGQYAGYDEDGDGKKELIFRNFYLEPEFADDLDATTPLLSDNKAFHGDMFGFCLSDGSQALTNLPFYVAGYGSYNDDPSKKKTAIFPFTAHKVVEGTNVVADKDYALYELAYAADKYTVQAAMTQKNFKDGVAAVKALEPAENLDAGSIDVRRAIVRNNAGVMTGDYIAYYPYNAEFYERGGIPLPLLNEGKVLRTGVTPSENQEAAITAADFYDKLFAVSGSALHVDGKTKSGDVSLTPRTGAIFFMIYNAEETLENDKNKDVKIKRIVVQAQENAAETDFIHGGTVPMNNLMAIKGTKSTSMIGVQFNAATSFTSYDKGNAQWAMTYCYPNLQGKAVQLKVYDDKGRVAIVKKSDIPALGASVSYTVKVNELDFQATEREIFTNADFNSEVGTEGTLILMDNITSSADLGKKLTIKGGYTLTLKGEINADLTMNGSDLVLNTAGLNANISSNQKVTLKTAATYSKKISATTLVNEATVTLKNAAVTTLENKGTLNVQYLQDASVVVGTLNNHNALNVAISGTDDKTSVLTVTTLNNKVNMGADPKVTVAASAGTQHAQLAATTINNNATAKFPNNKDGIEYTPEITISGKTTASTVSNAGTLTWSSPEAMNYAVTNSGTFTINSDCETTGVVTNNGTLNVGADKDVEINAGGITTTNTTNVNGNLIAAKAKFTVNGGVVNCYGTVNGSSNIEVKAGEFIKYVGDAANLQAAIATTGVAARYNAICVNAATSADFKFSTEKKVYLNAGLTTAEPVEFKDVVTRGDVVYTATGNATMSTLTIESGDLTLNSGVINIAGTFTNKGSYNSLSTSVVNCAEIDGSGTWGKYPNF